MKAKLATLAAALLLGASPLSTPAFADAKPKVTMIIYTAPGLPFFNPLLQGAKDAAGEQDIDLDIQYGNSDQVTQNNLIQTAVANKVAGIAVAIWDDKAFHKNICDAASAEIPVVAFNIDNSKGAAGDLPAGLHRPGLRQLGLSDRQTSDPGRAHPEGRPGIHAGGVPRGRLCDVAPRGRAEGARRSRRQVRDGGDGGHAAPCAPHSDRPSGKMRRFWRTGLQPLIETLPAGGQAELPVAGFDVSSEVLDAIKSGKIIATVDQQPYSRTSSP